MQIPIIGRRGQQKPWGSIPWINPLHPLAQGLSFYIYDCNGVVLDLVNGGIGTYQIATPVVRPYVQGTGVKYTGGEGTASVCIAPVGGKTAYTNFGGTLPYSFVCGTFYLAAAAAANTRCIATTTATDNTEDTGPAFFTDGGTTTPCVIFNNGVAGVTPFNGSYAANTFQTWGVVSSTSTTADFYLNGKLDKNATGLSSTNTSCASLGKIGAFSINNGTATNNIDNGGLSANGAFMPFYAAWNRALSAAEFKQVYDDPYCFLIYPEDYVFATLVGVTTPVTTSADQYLQGWSSIGRKIIIRAG